MFLQFLRSALDPNDHSSGKFSFLLSEAHGGAQGIGRKRTKVIVVDDEPAIADSLADILNGEGFDAVSASSGSAALLLAEQTRPDVVISDVAMPGINGIETVRLIRRFLPECRFILFSGHAGTSDLLKHANADGEKFELLPKPIRPHALLDLLRPPGSKQ